MVSLDWSTDRTGGVTLVTLRVESHDRDRRVRVENRIEGPTWPPRRQGRPAAGWDETGFAGVVRANEPLALGYATPGEPTEPPVEVVADDPLPEEPGHPDEPTKTGQDDDTSAPEGRGIAGGSGRIGDATPAGVVRSLGDPVVPREAVPFPGEVADTDGPAGSSRDGSLSARLAAIERRLAALER
jgi:hypothetical protein